MASIVTIYLNEKKNKMMNEIPTEEMNKHKYMNFWSIRFSSILEKEFLLYNFFPSSGNEKNSIGPTFL